MAGGLVACHGGGYTPDYSWTPAAACCACGEPTEELTVRAREHTLHEFCALKYLGTKEWPRNAGGLPRVFGEVADFEAWATRGTFREIPRPE